jgi:intracellular multiplication protein IcmG
MADKYEGDSEYHFSDEEGDFDIETEAANARAPVERSASGNKLNQYRRQIIGAVVFVVLIFLVYKIMVPTSANNTSAIADIAPVTATPAATKPLTLSEQPKAAAPEGTEATMPVVQPATSAQAEVTDKITAAAEENSRQINQLQAEYAQKITEYEAQNNMLQGKLDDLSMRMATLESNINRLGQVIQEMKAPPKPMPTAIPLEMPQSGMGVKQAETHGAYTVQAIIPGRAWLKSESGETITVAEGDTIKGYGRVVKIDPYDGVVNINTGQRMVSLSYGVSAE